ncbi:hypothetical protein J2S47_000985 [Streptomyces griseoviridis]|uniref:Transposase IS110-like N-terminal domain-containing protein n=1 Tax=Streptomyces griseoviridis TaxID=45398 RepID=A0ABT9L9V0_STRGD|nr:hypothetical protein [Streptomyces griseoviridis]GGT08681.1 hypothetical protein GCM10010240_47650 [Streptomyces griseoviridis]
MVDIDGVGVFLGLDVGRHAHHGHGPTPAGKRVFDTPLPNGELHLRAVSDKLKAEFGTVLVVVDQPASIGALPRTVARDSGCEVACPPGLAMRRSADLHPGEARTDAKDAAVIADAARTMPHTPRSGRRTARITRPPGVPADAPARPLRGPLRTGRNGPNGVPPFGVGTRPSPDPSGLRNAPGPGAK